MLWELISAMSICAPQLVSAEEAPGGGWYYDWGLIYKEHPVSKMYDYVNHPLADATIKDLDSFDWPDPFDPARWAGLREKQKNCMKRQSMH